MAAGSPWPPLGARSDGSVIQAFPLLGSLVIGANAPRGKKVHLQLAYKLLLYYSNYKCFNLL
ncbi:hypothetical protein SAMN05660652_03993 [Propionivibrio dicarboxylicus]|uniref:Uncharacterized protein n=1 Tax=Propionivibrio dicarboxylicus TaxID=83767 RepID=A0A1G8N6D8_9RHOO|nr:hypothetical protein SAMN05660652_03993 [Propionivibrio dicarboxylicus]